MGSNHSTEKPVFKTYWAIYHVRSDEIVGWYDDIEIAMRDFDKVKEWFGEGCIDYDTKTFKYPKDPDISRMVISIKTNLNLKFFAKYHKPQKIAYNNPLYAVLINAVIDRLKQINNKFTFNYRGVSPLLVGSEVDSYSYLQ